MADSSLLDVGATFSTFENLSDSIKRYEETHYTTLYTRSSRTIEATKKRATKRYFNSKLKYTELDYACIHGGRQYKSTSNSRKEQK